HIKRLTLFSRRLKGACERFSISNYIRKEVSMKKRTVRFLSSLKDNKLYRYFDEHFNVITCISVIFVIVWNIYFYA
ncbi:hypothetical protein D9J80_24985, partial [Escherichia coli]|nr:hypothetical protein [Escherichia coli]